MPRRRSRPTIRCLTADLGLELPALDVDLGELDHPWMDELRRITPASPRGQKRILSIDHPLVYRLRVGSERGATWIEDDIVWLCAARRREEGSEDDPFKWFSQLHALGELPPTDDDHLRDRAEAAIRLHRALTSDLCRLIDSAMSEKGNQRLVELCDWLPCRALTVQSNDVEEIWCALSILDVDGDFVREPIRDSSICRIGEACGSGNLRGAERLAYGQTSVVRGSAPRVASAMTAAARNSLDLLGRLAEEQGGNGGIAAG